MTADRRAALVEKMCIAVATAWDNEQRMQDGMSAALDLALEEAAKVCDKVSADPLIMFGHDAVKWQETTANDCAAGIRALKGNK